MIFSQYGSYCNFQVGLENGDKDIEVMRHGMPERGIWLAGEHTAPFVALVCNSSISTTQSLQSPCSNFDTPRLPNNERALVVDVLTADREQAQVHTGAAKAWRKGLWRPMSWKSRASIAGSSVPCRSHYSITRHSTKTASLLRSSTVLCLSRT